MIKALAIILAGIGFGFIAYQLKPKPPIPTPTWQEQTLRLSDIEQATMSGDFTKEFQTALAEENQAKPDRPLAETLISMIDVPSSMAGGILAPTVTINGGPSEGSTIAYPNPCFPLWVNDNMTPWQQLATRTKLNSGQWSNWMNQFSYCFDNLGNGSHTVSIQIKDLAGNISSEVKRVFVVKR